MAKWEEIDPREIGNFMETNRGRVSYPILKGFLETGFKVSRLDRTGIHQSPFNLAACLNTYIKSHSLPIKIFQRQGELFAARLDLDAEGNPNPTNNDISQAGEYRRGLPDQKYYLQPIPKYQGDPVQLDPAVGVEPKPLEEEDPDQHYIER